MEQTKQSDINKILALKLEEKDIDSSTVFCTKALEKNRILYDLMSKTRCNHCPEHDNCLFAIPEGNINSDVMIVGYMPSELDGQTHTTMYDASGRFMSVILDKLGKSMDNIYITNVTKCYTEDKDVSYVCMSTFLQREIELVKPKTIITLGLDAANIMRKVFLNLPSEEDIGVLRKNFIDIPINYGVKIKLIHTLDPRDVIGASASLYVKYKSDIWNDIRVHFKK